MATQCAKLGSGFGPTRLTTLPGLKQLLQAESRNPKLQTKSSCKILITDTHTLLPKILETITHNGWLWKLTRRPSTKVYGRRPMNPEPKPAAKKEAKKNDIRQQMPQQEHTMQKADQGSHTTTIILQLSCHPALFFPAKTILSAQPELLLLCAVRYPSLNVHTGCVNR